MKTRTLLVLSLAALLLAEARGGLAVGTWWWDGRLAVSPDESTRRLDFLSAHGVTEIYLCLPHDVPEADVAKFIRAAAAKRIRVAYLSGDVSWIEPGSLGFDEIFAHYMRYQRSAPEDARFFALHLDVEPHQNTKLPDERKWQLYADFVARAAARVHRAGEKIEWDIPFWLDDFKVWRGEQQDASLLELLMDVSDGVTLMSYRDTASAVLDVGKNEIALAKGRKCRVLLGTETGQTSEGNHVSFYEEGKAVLDKELGKIKKALVGEMIPGGSGVAVHHVGSWMSLKD